MYAYMQILTQYSYIEETCKRRVKRAEFYMCLNMSILASYEPV